MVIAMIRCIKMVAGAQVLPRKFRLGQVCSTRKMLPSDQLPENLLRPFRLHRAFLSFPNHLSH